LIEKMKIAELTRNIVITATQSRGTADAGRRQVSNVEHIAPAVEFDRDDRPDGAASPVQERAIGVSSGLVASSLGGPGLLALSWAMPVAIVVLWEVLARTGWLSAQVLPAPSKVLETAVKLARSGTLLVDLAVSLRRAAIGFAVGGSIGLGLGTLVGFSRVAEAAIDRSVQMVRAIPFLALLPLVIVWFGVGEGQKIFLVALGVSFPIYINTTLGIRQVDPKLIELGKIQGLDALQLIRRIILPGALPSILTGVRYALATSWLALVVAETIGAQSGIGFLAMDAREFLRTDVIVLTVAIYALIGVAADAVARVLERRLLAWHPNYGRVR
jgi:sulfonate transport system permease protein